MAWKIPTITVKCDGNNCTHSTKSSLHEVSPGVWDASKIEGGLIKMGWRVEKNNQLCSNCAKKATD